MKKIRLKKVFICVVCMFCFSQVVFGLHNVYTYNRIFEKSAGQWVKKHKNELRNPNNKSPFTMLVLRFPQLAYWAGADKVRIDDFVPADDTISNPKNRPFMEGKHFTADTAFCVVKRLTKKGFKAKDIVPQMHDVKPNEIVHPDLVAIQYTNTNYKLIDKLKKLKNLEQIHTKWDNHVAFFRVM